MFVFAGSMVIYLQAGDVVEYDPASNSNSTLIDKSELVS